MTICIEKYWEKQKFLERCVFHRDKGTCKECMYPNFEKVEISTRWPTITVETDLSCEEVETLLKRNKVQFLWVSQF